MHGYWAQFLTVAVAHMLAVASPGPDFAMVLRQSLAHGRRAAIWTSIGIGSAILLHVTYAVLGIGILLRESPFLFTAVKFLAAAYLAWIGAKALRTKPRREMPGAPAGAEARVAATGGARAFCGVDDRLLHQRIQPQGDPILRRHLRLADRPGDPEVDPGRLRGVDVPRDNGLVLDGVGVLHPRGR